MRPDRPRRGLIRRPRVWPRWGRFVAKFHGELELGCDIASRAQKSAWANSKTLSVPREAGLPGLQDACRAGRRKVSTEGRSRRMV